MLGPRTLTFCELSVEAWESRSASRITAPGARKTAQQLGAGLHTIMKTGVHIPEGIVTGGSVWLWLPAWLKEHEPGSGDPASKEPAGIYKGHQICFTDLYTCMHTQTCEHTDTCTCTHRSMELWFKKMSSIWNGWVFLLTHYLYLCLHSYDYQIYKGYS